MTHTHYTHAHKQEFFRQGDRERQLELPISPFVDRFKTNVPKSQLGFLNFVVKPCFKVTIQYNTVHTHITYRTAHTDTSHMRVHYSCFTHMDKLCIVTYTYLYSHNTFICAHTHTQSHTYIYIHTYTYIHTGVGPVFRAPLLAIMLVQSEKQQRLLAKGV